MEDPFQAPTKEGIRTRLNEDYRQYSGPFRHSFRVATWAPLDLSQALVIMGFPTVGLVGSIATAHLVESLRLREVGAVLSPALPPAAVIRDGIGTSPIRVYLGDMMCGIDGRCDQLCVIHSDITPKSTVVSALAYSLVAWAKARRARQLVCLEGLKTEASGGEAHILGIASDAEGRNLLQRLKIDSLENGLLTGIGGVALYAARAQDLPALCFLAQTHEDIPDARGAARLLELLDPLVPLVPINTLSLYAKAQALEAAFREQLEHSSRAMKDLTQRADMMYG